jgi:hypothetical protein
MEQGGVVAAAKIMSRGDSGKQLKLFHTED